MKYFRMSYEEVVFKRSYLNILLLNRSIPSLGIEDKSENGRKNASTQKIDGNFRNENDLFMSLM